MSHPSARRSALSAAAAVGVGSLVTGSLLFVASPAPADSDKQPGNGHGHAAGEQPNGNSSPRGSSAQQQHAQSPQEPAQREPQGNQPGNQQDRQQSAHASSPGSDVGKSSSRPSDAKPARHGTTQDGDRAPTGHNASPGGHEKSGKTSPDDRPGNQGTIKIDSVEFDSHPNNQPHVGCTFQVDFYNYGKGKYDASVAFLQHPPTPGDAPDEVAISSGSAHPFIGEDGPGGGTDVDAQETYQLDLSGDPHPKQGYHVKVTIHAPDSLGADTKHKVFWVQPCEATQPPTDEESTPPPTDETTPPDEGETTPPDEDQSLPPGHGDQTTPPGGGTPMPPGDEQTDAAPPLPGQPGANGPAMNGSQSGQAPLAQVPPAQVPPAQVRPARGARPGAAARGGSASASGPAAGAPQAGAPQAGAPQAGAPQAGVPTSVDAGLSGHQPADATRTAAGALAGLGGLMLAAAGVLGRRRRGEHQV